MASLVVLSARAQFAYSFVTSVGSGSFTLNTNNLVFTGSDGNAAAYTDTLDSLIFNGVTYTNLAFNVFNNFSVFNYVDGFQILVNKSPYSSASTLELDVWGNNSVVNGTTVSDLLTVLSSFNSFETERRVEFFDPSEPFYMQDGTITSFQLLPAFTTSGSGILTNCFGFNIAGNTNATVVVEACTNMANPVWVPVQTNILTSGSIYFSDPGWTNYPSRFYRLRSP